MTSPCRFLARLASSACLVAAGASAAVAQPQPVSRLPCGGYEAVPSATAASGRPSRVSIQKGGRLLVTVSDWAITRLDCEDVDNDNTLELFVTSFSGGPHCCETLRVWTLGESPRPLLRFESGSAAGFELRDLDRDGRRELLLGDDAFAYFDDLCDTCSPARLPLVACVVDGRFEDCTRRFPDLLRAELKRYLERLRPPASTADVGKVEGAALGALAVSVLLGEEERGLDAIRTAVSSDQVMAWLERARPEVRDWAAARGRRLKDGKD
jgi:hypothetical protein